jgi:hypothetical protein
MTLHRVFGAGQPYAQEVFTDGTPNIRLASLFYLLAGQTWQCVGGRVYIPTSAPIQSTGIRVMAWTGAHETPIDIGAAPLRSADAVTLGSAGWVEVSWAPFDVVGGVTAVAVGYEFLTQVSTYLYTAAAAVGADPVQAADGSPFYFAEQAYTGGRSRFKIGADPVGPAPFWYGSDIVLDDGVSTGPEPLTAYWNDGGVQRSGELYYNAGAGAAPVVGVAKG